MVVLFLCYTCYNESRGEIYVSFYTFHDITLLEPGLRIRVELTRIRPPRETVSGYVPRKKSGTDQIKFTHDYFLSL